MAIALDVASNSGLKTASPFTWNHTVASGSNCLLVVGLNLSSESTSQVTATAVTYNGVSMVKVRGDQNSGVMSNTIESSIWFLYAPATGTNVVSVTATNFGKGLGGAVSYTGALQSNSADAVNGKTGTLVGLQTFTVTTVVNNCWIFSAIHNVFSTVPGGAIAGTHTERWDVGVGTGDGGGEDTNGPITPPASTTIGWTMDSESNQMWAMSGASFAPAPVGAGFFLNMFNK